MEEPTHKTATTPAHEQVRQEAKREFVELIKLAVVFLVIFWVMRTFVIEGYEVQGESMSPTLNDRDRILVFKLPHEISRLSLFSGIQPFQDADIIVFEGAGHKRYVKRVIAHNPRTRRGTVDAQHLDAGAETEHQVKVEFDRGIVRVNNWQIDESAYLPAQAANARDQDHCMLNPGEYYVLGDHRQVSKDSRSFRAVSDQQIVGRAILRFWPVSKFGLL